MATIQGIDKLVVKLNNIKNLDLTKGLEKACLIVENSAKEKCPVETGQLRNSITHEVDNNIGTVGTNVYYAPYVEFGTGIYSSQGNGRQTKWRYKTEDGKWHTTEGQTPQPYLQPALLENKEQVIDVIRKETKEAIG